MGHYIEIEVLDNSKEVWGAIDNAIKRGLIAIGQNAVTHTQEYIRQEGRIDTGNMRGSIEHNEGDNMTVIGSNVYYTVFQELGTIRGIAPAYFLTRAAKNHMDEYKNLLMDSIKNA